VYDTLRHLWLDWSFNYHNNFKYCEEPLCDDAHTRIYGMMVIDVYKLRAEQTRHDGYGLLDYRYRVKIF
jgi:hypothetical protein